MFCIFSSCGQESTKTTESIYLRFDKKYNILSIWDFESARYINKLDLDLQRDTLIICKASKKLILPPTYRKTVTRKTAAVSAVKLLSNIEYVKYGGELFKLSELEEFSIEEFMETSMSDVIIIDYPKKFPCKIP